MGSKWGNYHNVENSLKCFLISGFELKKKKVVQVERVWSDEKKSIVDASNVIIRDM